MKKEDVKNIAVTLGSRLVDPKDPLSVTNLTTAGGGGLMGFAYLLLQLPDPSGNLQIAGGILAGVGFLVSFYKENKK